jgi:hypothetical protein
MMTIIAKLRPPQPAKWVLYPIAARPVRCKNYPTYMRLSPGVFRLSQPYWSPSARALRLGALGLSRRAGRASFSAPELGSGAARPEEAVFQGPGYSGSALGRLSTIHRFRIRSWVLWVVVNLRRQAGKLRAWVWPRCLWSSIRPKSRLRKVAMT